MSCRSQPEAPALSPQPYVQLQPFIQGVEGIQRRKIKVIKSPDLCSLWWKGQSLGRAGQDTHTASECANCSCRCGCAPHADKTSNMTEQKWRIVKLYSRKTVCLSISISKGLQEQYCHIWHRHSCCWMTSRSLPAWFLYFHHRSFDLKLLSCNWVPTQSLKTSQKPTEEGLTIFSKAKIPTTASTSSLQWLCLLSKWPRCLLAVTRHTVRNASTWNNTMATFATFDSCQVCQLHREPYKPLI